MKNKENLSAKENHISTSQKEETFRRDMFEETKKLILKNIDVFKRLKDK